MSYKLAAIRIIYLVILIAFIPILFAILNLYTNISLFHRLPLFFDFYIGYSPLSMIICGFILCFFKKQQKMVGIITIVISIAWLIFVFDELNGNF